MSINFSPWEVLAKLMTSVLGKVWNWKEGRDLPNPGPFESLHREARSTE